MASRLKEDEKNEKAIRALLRKQSNRRCINCNSLGPQYVCLNFWTFVCTQCSGIHREFTHRVKSVSMSKFTSQEVTNLENGGNEHAREIYFKDWDPQRQPLPDSSNVDRLRDFIKMVYVERRLSGERTRLSGERTRMSGDRAHGREADREGLHENRHSESRPSYRGQSRSPPYEDRLDDKYPNERGIRNNGRNSPLPVRPVKEILGEDVPPLFVGNNKNQINGGHEKEKLHVSLQDGSGQQIRSSSILRTGVDTVPSVPPVVKREEPTSLIDFGTDSEPPTINAPGASFDSNASALNNNTGWASFETFPKAAITHAMVPSAQPVSAAMAGTTSFLTPDTQNQVSADNHSQVNGNAQWIAEWSTASQPSAVQSNADDWSSFGQSSSLTSNQPWNTFQESYAVAKTAPDAQMHSAREITTAQVPTLQHTQGPSDPNLVANPTLVKSTRAELPEDLFAGRPQMNSQFAGYPPARSHYLQMGGMGLAVGGYNQPQLPKSVNPFDLPGETSYGQTAGEFPRMASMQAALPNLNMGSMPLFRPASGGYGHQWQLDNAIDAGRVSYPTTNVASGVPYMNQHMPNSSLTTMQQNRVGIAGTRLTSSVQNTQPFSGASMFPVAAPSTSYGVYHGQIAHNNLSFQNLSTPMASELYQGQGFIPQTSVGSLNKIPTSGSGFPPHRPQQFIVQNTFGFSGNPVSDASFSAQASSSRTSLDPGGNPFG